MSPNAILEILDRCAQSFTFPTLDNGYVYLAATRMSLFRAETDWALTIEVFGFSPRAGIPDLCIYTFGSNLENRKKASDFVNEEAYKNYLHHNPNNEMHFCYPVTNEEWLSEEDPEMVGEGVCMVRDIEVSLPAEDQYLKHNIVLELDAPSVYEFCRYLAAIERDRVLATPEERVHNVPDHLHQVLHLEDWHHPDITGGELPSQTETFQQLAAVLSTGNNTLYSSLENPNTHWSNWPEGGTL